MSIGSVSGFWMDGRPSGLPNDIEDQLAEARSQQVVDPIEEDIEGIQTKLDTFEQLNSQLTTFLQATTEVAEESAFDQYQASSSDSTVVGVQSDSQAEQGSYNLDVTQLAAAHTLKVSADSGLDEATDASLIEDGMSLSFYHQGTQYSYTTDAQTTLSSLALTISEAENGVQASVNNVGSSDNPEYALILKSEASGSGDQQITTDEAGSSTGISLTDEEGEARDSLFVDDSTSWATSQQGQDAEFRVDGVDYTRSSNSVDDLIIGLTLTLSDSGSDVRIEVQRDSTSIVQGIEAFVSAYNTAQGFIDESTEYDSTSGESGALMNSTLAKGVEWQMRDLVIGSVAGTSGNAYSCLSDIGIGFDRQGGLEVDADQLQAAVAADPEAVSALFTGDNGVAERMSEALDDYTNSSDGLVTYKIESLEDKLERYQEDLEQAEEDVENYLDRLVQKYTAMENAILEYQSMQDQIDSLNDTFDAMYKG